MSQTLRTLGVALATTFLLIPLTGDENKPIIWIIVAAVAALAIIIVIIVAARKKKDDENEHNNDRS